MIELAIYKKASKNDDGDYTYTKETGGEVNVSRMFRPGKRKTGDVDMLVHEARLADETSGEDWNPSFPINGDVADRALERIEAEDLEPAWLLGPWEGNTHD